jgi:hypothetical protein
MRLPSALSLALDCHHKQALEFILLPWHVMFSPEVTIIDDHVILPNVVTTKAQQSWAEYLQSWTNM